MPLICARLCACVRVCVIVDLLTIFNKTGLIGTNTRRKKFTAIGSWATIVMSLELQPFVSNVLSHQTFANIFNGNKEIAINHIQC